MTIYRELTPLRKKEMVRALQVSALLFVGFLITTQQILAKSWLYNVDHHIQNMKHYTIKGFPSHVLIAIDDLGLRWFTATILITSAVLISWRFKSYRPLNLSILSLLALNGVVGASKLFFGRTKPRLFLDELHQGGMSYPSGHAANALVSWGLLSYLVFRYTKRDPFQGIELGWLAGVITLAVCIVSLIRRTHWFSDLLGGVLLGGAILLALIAIDRFVPSKKQPS